MTTPVTDVPFFRLELDDQEIAEVVDSLQRGWLTTGPKTRQFEADFARFIGGGVEAIAVNSATAGMHLALEALGVGEGDQVIVPDLTFTATAEVVRYLGADPVFVDIDPATLNIDVGQIEAKITARTKAIMPVHFAGNPCDMTAIGAIARKHGLKVLDDAAHALPARHGNAMIGASGSDAVVFSFYANKTITTGEGGMIVTRDAGLAKRARAMRLHGFDRDAFDRFTSNRAAWRYDVIAPGFKYNMTDMAAALGIHQLKKARRFQEIREARAAAFDEGLRDLPLILPPKPAPGDQHSWHLYIVRLTGDAPMGRDAFIERLQEEGIKTSVHYTPLHRLTYWRETYDLDAADFPGAEEVFQGTVTLPHFMAMTDAEQARVIKVVRSVLGG